MEAPSATLTSSHGSCCNGTNPAGKHLLELIGVRPQGQVAPDPAPLDQVQCVRCAELGLHPVHALCTRSPTSLT